jgi:hypothetical protein
MSTRNPPISITAIHIDAHSKRVKISVEIDGCWVEILNEYHADEHLSHIIEANGIRSRAEKVFKTVTST